MRRLFFLSLILGLLLLSASFAAADVYFPHADVADGWGTEICLINTSSSTVTGTMRGFDDSGNETMTPAALSLGPNDRYQVDAGSTYSGFTRGYLVFETTATTVVGYVRYNWNGLMRVGMPAVTEINQGDLNVFHVEADGLWWNGVGLVNTNSSSKTVTITFNTGQSFTKTLPANGHTAFLCSDLFGGSLPTDVKTATITNAQGVIGMEVYGLMPQVQGNYLTGLNLTGETCTELYFSGYKYNAKWWTGIDAYNPSPSGGTITITPYDSNGTKLDSVVLLPQNRGVTASINSQDKYVNAFSELNLPAGTDWVKLSSSAAITGFEVIGSMDMQMLGGYTATGNETKNGIFPDVVRGSGGVYYYLVNTEQTTANVTMRAFDNSGSQIASQSFTMPGNGQREGKPEDFFPGSIDGATYITVQSDTKMSGFQLAWNAAGTMLDALPMLSATGEINENLDAIMALLGGSGEYSDMLGDLMGLLTLALSGGGGTCPEVTVVPDLSGLESIDDLPSEITVTVDFGTGCTDAGGDLMSGSAQILITDLVIDIPQDAASRMLPSDLRQLTLARLAETTASISGEVTMVCNHLTRNGEEILNGTFSLSVDVQITQTGTIEGEVTLSFDGFTAQGRPASGSVTLAVTGLGLMSGELGTITVTVDDLWLDTLRIMEGLATISGNSDMVNMSFQATTQNVGEVDIDFTLTNLSDTSYVLRTPEPGTVGEYTVSISNLTWDTAICPLYPISGSITLIKGTNRTTITFNGSCDGTYQIITVPLVL